ncbi:hypothetical protein PG984_011900 [Apiospora sp. TS-2023a]
MRKGPKPHEIHAAMRSVPDQLRHFSPVNRPRSSACEGRCWEALEPPLVTAQDHQRAASIGSHPMSVWLERALVPRVEAKHGGRLSEAEKEATTLYQAIKAAREDLEQAGPPPWRPQLADYEIAAIGYLGHLKASGQIGSTSALAVVMVFGNGFRVYEYDGEQMQLRTDMKNVRVDFYDSLTSRDLEKYPHWRAIR